MRIFTKYLLLLVVTAIIMGATSCVSYRAKYRGDWERNLRESVLFYTVYLVGDAGNSVMGEPNLVFDHLREELDAESKSSAIVWLGDNIYPVGLAPAHSVYHHDGRYKLNAQLNTMSNFEGKKYFVLGNHDWYAFGRMGLRRQG